MLKSLLHNNFVRNVILIATGTASAQAITIAFSPLITRIYGPEAFGLLGTFTAIIAILAPITALTYPIGIVRPKTDDEGRAIAKLSVFLAILISLAAIVIIFAGGQFISKWFGLKDLAGYLLLVPVAMFFSVLQDVMQQWLIRKKQFKISARIAVSQSLIVNSAKVAAGLLYPFGGALIILSALGHALYAFQLWLGSRRWSTEEGWINKPQSKLPKLSSVANKHKDFALYRAPQVGVNALSQSVPVLLLASFFGPAVAGFYTLSRSVMAAPAELLGNSIGNVFFAQIAEAVNKGLNPRPFLFKATLGALGVALLPFSIVMIWGPGIFAFIFGSKWYEAGQYAQWVSVWLLFSLAARPVIATIPVLKMQGLFLLVELIFTIFKILGLLLGILVFKSAIYAVAFYSIISALLYGTLFFTVIFKR